MRLADKAIHAQSMETCMSMCIMAIDDGAHAGIIVPDDTTFSYIKDRFLVPRGAQ